MKKIIVILFLLAFFGFSNRVHSQYLENSPRIAQRIFYGGNLGMSFGDVTYIEVSPTVGYRITNRFSAGLGGMFLYTSSKIYDYKGYSFGGNIFASFTIIKNFSEILPFNFNGGLLIYGENSFLNVKNYYNDPDVDWVNTPMLGVGLQIPISSRSYLLLTILYNFNESRYSQYSNPVIRFAFQL